MATQAEKLKRFASLHAGETPLVLVANLLMLALAIWFKPNLAKRFLGGLVHSAGAHYLEVLLRLVVGLALLQAMPAVMPLAPSGNLGTQVNLYV